MLEWRQTERPLLRALVRELAAQTDWELVLLRTRTLGGRPTLPRALRGRVHVRTALDSESRAAVLRDAAVFVPAFDGLPPRHARGAGGRRRRLGAARPRAPARARAAEAARLIEDAAVSRQAQRRRGSRSARRESFGALADQVEQVYASLERRRRPAARPAPLEERDWIVVDLHMHTTWSHDCSIEVDDLLDHAEAEGLGAIAITDHNVFGGALEAVEKARGRKLIVIPGEEVKTDGEGEVIGLFLKEEIPRGMSFAETVAAIRAQGGLVYVPHPFDRLHSIPTPRRCSATSARSTSSRSTTPDCSSRATTSRRSASRASTTSPQPPDPTRTCSRESARGPFGCAVSRARRSSSSRCGAPRSCAARSPSRTSRD